MCPVPFCVGLIFCLAELSQVYGPGDGRDEHHMPYFDAEDFPRNLDQIWERHFGFLIKAGSTVIVGEWGGVYAGKDRLWQEAFSRFIHERSLGFFYWCLNPNSEDTGGLLRNDWKSHETGKLQLLQAAPTSPLAPILQGRPSFKCLAVPLAQHFRCASGLECIFQYQVCNGFFECRDHSDENTCPEVLRPCITIAGEDTGRPCALPFVYNNFQYDGCTLVDAVDAWLLRGVGLCQRGFIPSLAMGGGALDQCKSVCSRTANCSMISYTAAGGGYCSSYTTACRERPLNGARVDYKTYELHDVDDAGAWCPTEVGYDNTFLRPEHSGVCGPGCPVAASAHLDNPHRSKCSGGDNSDGGPAHCRPSPPPPPNTPSPPASPPPPMEPPPAPPPPYPPPPGLLVRLTAIPPAEMALSATVGFLLVLGIGVFVMGMRQASQRSERVSWRRPRRMLSEELEVLTHDHDGAVIMSGGRAKPPPSNHRESKHSQGHDVRMARVRWEKAGR